MCIYRLPHNTGSQSDRRGQRSLLLSIDGLLDFTSFLQKRDRFDKVGKSSKCLLNDLSIVIWRGLICLWYRIEIHAEWWRWRWSDEEMMPIMWLHLITIQYVCLLDVPWAILQFDSRHELVKRSKASAAQIPWRPQERYDAKATSDQKITVMSLSFCLTLYDLWPRSIWLLAWNQWAIKFSFERSTMMSSTYAHQDIGTNADVAWSVRTDIASNYLHAAFAAACFFVQSETRRIQANFHHRRSCMPIRDSKTQQRPAASGQHSPRRFQQLPVNIMCYNMSKPGRCSTANGPAPQGLSIEEERNVLE